ncbi:MAG: serine hydrolase [Verrucomicrobiota bacterium]
MRVGIAVAALLVMGTGQEMLRAQDLGGDIELRFKRFDKDSDGRIRQDEFPWDGPLFQRIDGDGDGTISIDELVEFSDRRRVSGGDDSPASKVIKREIPEGAPLSLGSCRAAAEYSARADGYSVLVMWDGEIVFEQYDNGWSEGTAHRLASGTKSFAGVWAAAAVEDGILESFDEKLSDTITEWQDDARLREITVRQLLTLTSGIDAGDNGKVPSYVAAVREVNVEYGPGEEFAYGPVPFQVFGEFMRRKLKGKHEIAYEYFDKRVLDAIGMKATHWRVDEYDQRHVPSGAFLTAREWVKFGEFMLSGGGEVVDSSLLEELTVGTEANRGYGMTFWLLGAGEASEGVGPGLRDKLAGAYMAAGAGKQRLFVIPELDLVVVRQGETKGRAFDNAKFLELLLEPEAE